MNLIGNAKLSEIVTALGGPKVRRGRCRAWYRRGENPTSVSIDDSRGIWCDYGSGQGGGVLALIEVARGCSRREAWAWLERYHGTPSAHRRSSCTGRGRRREHAQAEAARLIDTRDRVIGYLKAVRNSTWDECSLLEQWADRQSGFGSHPLWTEVAKAPGRRRIADGIDRYVQVLADADAAELCDLHQLVEGGAPC